MSKDFGQITKRPKQFKLGHLGTLNQVIVALGKTIRAMADGSVRLSGGLSDRQWAGDHEAVPGDQDAGSARGAVRSVRKHGRRELWQHEIRSAELTSRIEDLAERRLPRGGPVNIVGADAAECRKRLEEILGDWPTAGARPLHHDWCATL